MYCYAILANPGHNRIYFETAIQIACSELSAIAKSIDIEMTDLQESDLGLPACICFKTAEPLESDALLQISASSIFYAIFQVMPEKLLKPLRITDFHSFPESMVQILRYTGKTNEQFTRLMVNLALSVRDTRSERPVLLDPMCGKGTTLYEGLIRGFDVVGVEINEKWVEEIRAYLINFMKKGRYKHKAHKEKRTYPDGKKASDCIVLEAAPSKEGYKAGLSQTLKLFPADTRQSHHLIKKRSCDLLVSDLPYGVQHGSKQAKESKMDRSPLDLLQAAIPAWSQSLKSGAGLVLSFNEFTLKWVDVAAVLEAHGFTVMKEAPYIDFLHRVDQSIHRNLIVARKH